MPRRVRAEVLDGLAPEDPRARRSRRDLQRIHRAMGSLGILKSRVCGLMNGAQPRTILELGAGDGSLLLRVARAMRPPWKGVHVSFLDQHDIVSDETRRGFSRMGWTVSMLTVDVKDWVQAADRHHYDLCVTTLFLHHFEEPALRDLLAKIAVRADRFIACEPRRSFVAALGSRLVGCLGASRITREDAERSVAAGFRGTEIGAGWPGAVGEWRISEQPKWPFAHVFVATRAVPGA